MPSLIGWAHTQNESLYPRCTAYDDVIKWKHFPHNWLSVPGIHWSPVNSPLRGQWRGAVMFSLICTWINGRVNNGEAGDLRCYRAHYDVRAMTYINVVLYKEVTIPVTYQVREQGLYWLITRSTSCRLFAAIHTEVLVTVTSNVCWLSNNIFATCKLYPKIQPWRDSRAWGASFKIFPWHDFPMTCKPSNLLKFNSLRPSETYMHQ